MRTALAHLLLAGTRRIIHIAIKLIAY
ncbi:MAG: hypothetical protein RLZZ367_523, partial [Bacteroidota bacterium]